MTTNCGALTQKKKACPTRPFATTFRWGDLGLTVDVIPSGPMRCYHHLTDAERGRIALAAENRERLVESSLDGIDPARWHWPIPPLRLIADEQTEDAAAWDTLERFQVGRCAACGKPDDWLVRDHDHETGLVRGLLDTRCNGREGRWYRDDDLFARYRRRPPTTILGLTIRYVSPITGPDCGTARPPGWQSDVTEGIGF